MPSPAWAICIAVALGTTACVKSDQLEEARSAMALGREAEPAGEDAQTESHYGRAVEIYDRVPNSDPEEHAEALLALGKTQNRRCRSDEALETLARGERILERGGRGSPSLAIGFAYARGWIFAFMGEFAMARTETERAWDIARALPVTMQTAALAELGAFVADVEEERGNFDEAARWLERISTRMSKEYTQPESPLPFYHPNGIALRLHHAYRIAGASARARSLAARYTITEAQAGAPWPPAHEWVVSAGACAGLARGSSPDDGLDDTPRLSREIGNCFVKLGSQEARFLLNLLFSPEGRVLAVEGAAIDLEREQLECACRTATQAKLPPVGQGFRSRHFEGHTSGFNPDYRGM